LPAGLFLWPCGCSSRIIEGKEEKFVPTEQKAQIITDLTERLRRSKAVILLQTQGLSVADQIDLRKKLRASNIEFQVVKNTLLRIATHEAGVANIDSELFGPTAIAIGYDEEAATAKAVFDYIRTSKIVTVKAGFLGRMAFKGGQLEDISKLPGKNDARAQGVGVIQGPLNKAYGVFNAPLRDFVQILHNYAEQQGGSFA
jgi:large subunit ribosomal protein L10